jgi:hypothetical protein
MKIKSVIEPRLPIFFKHKKRAEYSAQKFKNQYLIAFLMHFIKGSKFSTDSTEALKSVF